MLSFTLPFTLGSTLRTSLRAPKLIAAVALAAVSAVPLAQAEDDMDTVMERASYIFGYNMAQPFIKEQLKLDTKVFTEGMKDAFDGEKPRMTEEEMQQTMKALQTMQQAKRAEFVKEVTEKNQKEGKAFLAANAKKDGVKTTASGLQYKVLTKGTGASPKADSKVTVNYSGRLLDGTEFDSSYRRGEPVTFGVNQVIPGWTEALQMMKEGAKWEVYIPADLAYGPGGSGSVIGPDATLIFDIELLKVEQ